MKVYRIVNMEGQVWSGSECGFVLPSAVSDHRHYIQLSDAEYDLRIKVKPLCSGCSIEQTATVWVNVE